jgi:hypothetical protein
MKRVLLSLLAVVLILGALGAAGFAGYQFGYRQGALSSNGDGQVIPRGGNFGPGGMPMHNFGFDRDFGRGFGMMHRGISFGFFPPFLFLARLAFWALVIWAIYMLATRSGWRLTKTTTTGAPPPPTVEVEKKESDLP